MDSQAQFIMIEWRRPNGNLLLQHVINSTIIESSNYSLFPSQVNIIRGEYSVFARSQNHNAMWKHVATQNEDGSRIWSNNWLRDLLYPDLEKD